MVYEAKKDKVVYVFPIVFAIIIIFTKVYDNSLDYRSIFFAILLSSLIIAFILCNMLTIKYIFTESELIIKTCFFKTVLRLDKITQIKYSRGTYSFSASSCEQLKLTYMEEQIICISPQNITEFEDYLKQAIKMAIQEK